MIKKKGTAKTVPPFMTGFLNLLDAYKLYIKYKS